MAQRPSTTSDFRSRSNLNNYLPTGRSDFIITHPLIQIANLRGDSSKLAPTWNKVTKTAYEGKARLCGGYGRRMMVNAVFIYIETCISLIIINIIMRLDFTENERAKRIRTML
jgi:hypothetical protein